MSARPVTDEEFDGVWKQSDVTFTYALNKGLMILYAVLLGGFWSYWLISVLTGGLDLVLGIVGGLFLCVTVFVGFNVLFWRHFARVSGVVCTDEALFWRQGAKAWAAPWSTIDFDALGLTNYDMSSKTYEYHLTVAGQRLYVFRAHIRLKHLELFIGLMLKHLKAAGRTPQADGDAKSRKASKARRRTKKGS